MTDVILAAEGDNSYVIVYVLFLVAGLLTGGAYSLYKQESVPLAIIVGVCAVVAAVAGVLWAVGVFA